MAERCPHCGSTEWPFEAERAETGHRLRRQNAALVKALRRYGRHEPGCASERHELCDCGFAGALTAALRQAKGGEG